MNKRIKKKKFPKITVLCSPLALGVMKHAFSKKYEKKFKWHRIKIETDKCLDYKTWYLMRGEK